ncbi:two-component system sensor protein [Acidisarcina polymorpha]|uniref:Two-component system sensor protein n=1 Tax=Acidisarcina polymorpha TaxID=2211140 RepID=A0A2Z5G0X5_9BACT|nr:histidine kinase [Acidisarcina polymorpha]AXC12813.1 two-component system sensor protein [Acidisarcina polymorpha]
MKSSDYFKVGPRLTLAFALLMALILAGNGFVIWQFHVASIQIDRLTAANRRLIAVMQLQVGLLSFHQRLDDLARSGDAHQLADESGALRLALQEQAQRAGMTAANLGTQVDPAFLPTLKTIEVALSAQLDAINDLAKSGDWGTVQRRLDNELKPIESQTSVLVGNFQQQANAELTQAVWRMGSVQRRIFLVVPITAVSTFFIAAFFGWAMTRRIVELRLEERVSERTRIARELHDTLLQSLHGLMFEFQAARNMFRKRPEEALQALDSAIVGTERAIIESQEAIEDLRSTATAEDDLAQLIKLTGENFATPRSEDYDPPAFGLTVEGQQRALSPVIRDEVYGIARELLRNAFRHAQARRIEAEILYDEYQLRVRVRDDGRGMDPQVLEQGMRPGHWGLPGVRERAQQIGGKLDVWSEAGAGTEVQLSVTALVAYEKASIRSRFEGSQGAENHEHRS